MGDKSENEAWQPGLGAVLEIGDDVGALVLYTDEEFVDREIEIGRLGEDRRVHTAIHRRQMGDRFICAGVYPDLLEGLYRVWIDRAGLPDRVAVTGGHVTELDWRGLAVDDGPLQLDERGIQASVSTDVGSQRHQTKVGDELEPPRRSISDRVT
jgi:hypothetical protein